MADLDELSERFRNFARTTARRAPLYSRLSAGIADDAELTALLAAAPAEQQAPVLLFAAVHSLLLAGEGPGLARYYPNLTTDAADGDALPEFRRFALAHAEELRDLVATRHTQTNEVGRCAQFLPAFGLVSAEAGPLAHLDVGASAGLNLLWPLYSYDYRPGGRLGAASAVHLECATRGTPPIPVSMPPVTTSLGIDLAPIDIHDDGAVQWLEACVWPDQADRFARLVAAVGIAREVGPQVRTGDAVSGTASAIEELSGSGHPIVTTSWVLSYLTTDERRAFVAMLDDAGSRRDLSWVVAESPAQTVGLPVPTTEPAEEITVVSLIRWRDGLRTATRLATTHPHGFWLRWEHPLTTAQR